MHIPFEQLRADARIWVFQSDRLLNKEEVDFLSQNLKLFTEKWAAHKVPLNSSYQVLNNIHVIIGVDESANNASGCSIDTLMHMVQQLGNELDINFLDRKAVAYEINGTVKISSFGEIKGLIDKGLINEDTLVYNNLVNSKQQLTSEWRIEARKSWLKRFFKSSSITT